MTRYDLSNPISNTVASPQYLSSPDLHQICISFGFPSNFNAGIGDVLALLEYGMFPPRCPLCGDLPRPFKVYAEQSVIDAFVNNDVYSFLKQCIIDTYKDKEVSYINNVGVKYQYTTKVLRGFYFLSRLLRSSSIDSVFALSEIDFLIDVCSPLADRHNFKIYSAKDYSIEERRLLGQHLNTSEIHQENTCFLELKNEFAFLDNVLQLQLGKTMITREVSFYEIDNPFYGFYEYGIYGRNNQFYLYNRCTTFSNLIEDLEQIRRNR